jgi:hypothetical protein
MEMLKFQNEMLKIINHSCAIMRTSFDPVCSSMIISKTTIVFHHFEPKTWWYLVPVFEIADKLIQISQLIIYSTFL